MSSDAFKLVFCTLFCTGELETHRGTTITGAVHAIPGGGSGRREAGGQLVGIGGESTSLTARVRSVSLDLQPDWLP